MFTRGRREMQISSPNECDKILKIWNEQTEPTDYMANCSTDYCYCYQMLFGKSKLKCLKLELFMYCLLMKQ